MNKPITTKPKLKELFEEKKTTQRQVAEQIGVSTQSINAWARGSKIPRADHVYKLARALSVNLTQMYEALGFDVSAFDSPSTENKHQEAETIDLLIHILQERKSLIKEN